MATVLTQQGGVKILWALSTTDLASTTTGTSAQSAGIVFAGAMPGDLVLLGTKTAVVAGLHYSAFVSAVDEIKIQVANVSAGTIDSASQVFTVGLVKLNAF
jgi:hypothetical protein